MNRNDEKYKLYRILENGMVCVLNWVENCIVLFHVSGHFGHYWNQTNRTNRMRLLYIQIYIFSLFIFLFELRGGDRNL